MINLKPGMVVSFTKYGDGQVLAVKYYNKEKYIIFLFNNKPVIIPERCLDNYEWGLWALVEHKIAKKFRITYE